MRTVLASFAGLLALVQSASALNMYDQCGGQGWTGAKNCPNGASCVYVNAYYSQCQPSKSTGGGGGGSCGTTTVYQTQTQTSYSTTTLFSVSTATVTVATTETDTVTGTITSTVTVGGGTTTTSSSSSSSPTSTDLGLTCADPQPFQFTGVSSSGAEFGTANIPGQYNKDYTFPNNASLDWFFSKGMNFIRLPFLMERLIPVTSAGLAGDYNQTYLGYIQGTVAHITGQGKYVALDPHNYMRYNGSLITDPSAFSGFWYLLAKQFANNEYVIFDLQNEPNGIDASVVFDCEQAAIFAIRAAGATSQLILLEGTSWTGAWTWTTSSGNAAAFATIQDPNNNFAIEMHQYLDTDGSGTNGTCLSPAIGAQRLAAATEWLQENNYKGFLGEIGAGNNDVCTEAVYVALCSMAESGAWLGFSWWAAGPWWGSYFSSIEPGSGPDLAEVFPQAIQPFIPSQ